MSARILCIDDNAANLELMVYLLRAVGHAPDGVQNATDGLKALENEPYALVLTDIRMPDCDGYEFVRSVRAHPVLRDIRLVAVTALAMVGDRERILGSGFDGYIAKPIEPQSFLDSVEAYLSDAGRERRGDVSDR